MSTSVQLSLSDLVIALSQQQDGTGTKAVQIITTDDKGVRKLHGISAVFSVKELPGVVLVQATGGKL